MAVVLWSYRKVTIGGTGHASQTLWFIPQHAGSKAKEREMSSHVYGPMDCGTFTMRYVPQAKLPWEKFPNFSAPETNRHSLPIEHYFLFFFKQTTHLEDFLLSIIPLWFRHITISIWPIGTQGRDRHLTLLIHSIVKYLHFFVLHSVKNLKYSCTILI